MKFECYMSESDNKNKVITILLLDKNNKGYYSAFELSNIDELDSYLEATLNSIISKRNDEHEKESMPSGI